ncbi:MAG TPA: molecular chaperone DnaJ [Gaiellaceae bacterium]|nr:molecular chaperone DnaJ [Gaiellaceae bacterium]
MSTTERDYYDLLGVPRTADEQTIKKAFRKLARELHPDVSGEPDAELRFREVSEAYEALSNPETRQLYDRYGHAGLRTGGFQPSHFDLGNFGDLFSAFFGDDLFGSSRRRGSGASRGADVLAQVTIELVDSAHGVKLNVPLETATTCSSCHGSGAAPGSAPVTCPRCGGHGVLQQVSRGILGEFIRQSACPDCNGSGRKIEHQCEACGGGGRTMETHDLEVEIPAGIHDGQRIRITGQGHAGALGGSDGDAYVQVNVRPDERFVREGNDIFSQVDLTIVQAALGAKVSVETLEGAQELEFDPGTQPGDVRVLRGKGMPVLQGFGHGDQRVLVNVTVPRRLTDEQRRLLDEFEQLSDDDTYHHHQGFFEKLKSAFL